MVAQDIALTVLTGVSSICILILTIYLCMLLFAAYKLLKNANKTCDMINSELKPVIEDLKETVSGVNSIIKAADDRVKFINCAVNSVVGATGVLGGKLKSVFSGVLEGFKAGINLTRRK